jgi:hypothetical protein
MKSNKLVSLGDAQSGVYLIFLIINYIKVICLKIVHFNNVSNGGGGDVCFEILKPIITPI